MKYKFIFILCISAFYLVGWYYTPAPSSKYVGDGVTKTIVKHENVILEMFTKDLRIEHFRLTYEIPQDRDKYSGVYKHNLFNFKQYRRFINMAEDISGLNQQEVAKGINKILALANKNPYLTIQDSPTQKTQDWYLQWRITQNINIPEHKEDNIPLSFSLIGYKNMP